MSGAKKKKKDAQDLSTQERQGPKILQIESADSRVAQLMLHLTAYFTSDNEDLHGTVQSQTRRW